ncbi:hypothetical protein F652_2608 [Enterobacteriaceae bacterium bta3-1]|nr:hypothetical protein F652_2608 [Enterobacteriaceae bacterium bta3-1]
MFDHFLIFLGKGIIPLTGKMLAIFSGHHKCSNIRWFLTFFSEGIAATYDEQQHCHYQFVHI